MLNKGVRYVLVCMTSVCSECAVKILGDAFYATLVELLNLISLFHIFERFVDFVGPNVRARFQTLDVTSLCDGSFDCRLIVLQDLCTMLECFLYPMIRKKSIIMGGFHTLADLAFIP